LGQGLIFPALSTYVIDFLGRENKGLAIGFYLSLFDVGIGLGSPLFGWISDAAGYRTMDAIAGCICVILTVIFSIKAPVFKPSEFNAAKERGQTQANTPSPPFRLYPYLCI
jgi:MFS family permease